MSGTRTVRRCVWLAALVVWPELAAQVLRTEPPETRIVRLPGPARAEPLAVPPNPPKRSLPAGLERESGLFCQKQIGRWSERDARETLGKPQGERPAFAEAGTEDGRILAFTDPSGRHRELELDFDATNGLLRTVFVYPWYLSWADCRRLWGANVSAAKANKGRMFYSYLDRRVDVLVDADGVVVSLGLY